MLVEDVRRDAESAWSGTALDRAPLVALLRRDLDANVYLLGVLARGQTQGDAPAPRSAPSVAAGAATPASGAPGAAPLTADGEFRLDGPAGQPTAGVYRSHAGLVVPFGTELSGIARAARQSGAARLVVGRPEAVGAALSGERPPRLDRQQGLYRLTSTPGGARTGSAGGPESSGLRLARLDEVDEVCAVVAAMQAEELATDAARFATDGLRARIGRLILEGRTYIVRERGEITFHASANAQSADGAQLEAVWTAPERRGKGLATRALTDLSARLLRRLPRVVLGVATVNTPAVRLYERVGFQSAGPLRLVSY